MNLEHRLQHILRLEVYAQCATVANAEIAPSTLEDMSEGKEVQNDILIGKGKCRHMTAEGCCILKMSLHDTLRQACCTTSVENVCEVFGLQLVATLLHFLLMLQSLAHLQELIEVDAGGVLRVLDNMRVEDYQLLDMWTYLHHTQGNVVLILLAYENVADLGIRYHIFHLRLAAGGIERNGDGTNTVGAKVHKQALGLVLREGGYVFLHSHSHLQQGIADQFDTV